MFITIIIDCENPATRSYDEQSCDHCRVLVAAVVLYYCDRFEHSSSDPHRGASWLKCAAVTENAVVSRLKCELGMLLKNKVLRD